MIQGLTIDGCGRVSVSAHRGRWKSSSAFVSLMSSSPSTSLAFPSTEPHGSNSTASQVTPSPQRRQHLLSFRRISLPTAPTLLNRQSSASLISCDSLAIPHENTATYVSESSNVPQSSAIKQSSRSPASGNAKRPRRRRDSIKPVDETQAAKRRKIITEFYETERAYVEGLDLIYSHFLTPLIESLDTPTPLLSREDLIIVFSNFIDIWNLHRSFFTSLRDLLSAPLSHPESILPPLSPVLTSHFPYLSLYSPFVSNFSEVIARLSELQTTNASFDLFIKERESDDRCGKLKLRDWLLTIVQRCPRYLLLLKDLINCTDLENPERSGLIAAHSMLTKVTTSLDESLHSHAQTMSLLALQRATYNLPIQLVSPGRSLLKRGTLMQLDNSSVPKEREFLLFSDCLIWLANDRMIEAEWLRRSSDSGIGQGAFVRGGSPGKRPEFKRSRSKSENEIPEMTKPYQKQTPVSPKKASVEQSPAYEERWWFKGKADLVDVEVVLSTLKEPGDERRMDILNPEMSFTLYADNEQSRDNWVSAIRSAKASLLVSLNAMHPNSTLSSSSSTNHIRRSLQALPYLPEEDEAQTLPKRGKVDHFVPAVWVPDGKTGSCMRCGKSFGWRRRRHHCRLCGRCVCATCSERTFFISDPSANDPSKSARACNSCYDTVFPLIESSASEGAISSMQSGSTLSSFPSWKTQKPSPRNFSRPSELMELETLISGSPSKRVVVIRRSKARPLSHPVIPEVFGISLEESLRSGSESRPSLEPRDIENEVELNTQLTNAGQVLGDISNSPPPESAANVRHAISSFGDEDISPRAKKRFSMPAIALQTTAVTAHPKVSGEGRSKRFSLVLGSKPKPAVQVSDYTEEMKSGVELRHGIAAAKLQELLGRTSSAQA